MEEFAFALPVTVICELIGVPESERDEFRPLARSLTATLEPLVDEAGLVEADEAALKLAGMFASLVATGAPGPPMTCSAGWSRRPPPMRIGSPRTS